MSKTSDVLYGRQGGRMQPVPPRRRSAVVVPMPAGLEQLVDHLIVEHLAPRRVLDGVPVDELERWHAAEHRTRTPAAGKTRHPGHLRHEHPKAAMNAMGIKR